jgi:hypothetical protein
LKSPERRNVPPERCDDHPNNQPCALSVEDSNPALDLTTGQSAGMVLTSQYVTEFTAADESRLLLCWDFTALAQAL